MQQTQREFGTMSKINENRKRDINQSEKYDEILSTMQHMQAQLQKHFFTRQSQDSAYQNPKRCYNCGKTEHLAQQCL